MENIYEIPKCKRCGSTSVYTKIDGTIICKRCGYNSKEEKGGRRK